MISFFAINRLSIILICLIIFATKITGSEVSIFEKDDIKGLSSPPPPPLKFIVTVATKWCGKIGRSFFNFGLERKPDTCCREHAQCADVLQPMSTLHGLNSNWMPIFNCTCEQKFINCLKAVNNGISNKLGRFYYSASEHCMAKNYPIRNCKKYQAGTSRKRCIRYNMNTKKPKVWQLFDMPFYTGNA